MSNRVSYAFLSFVAFVVNKTFFFSSPGEPIPFQTCHSIQEECFVYTWENLKLGELKYFTHMSFVVDGGSLFG